MKTSIILITLIFISLTMFCSGPEEKKTDSLQIPLGFKKNYKIESWKDASYPYTKRIAGKIRLLTVLKKDDVLMNCKHAIKKLLQGKTLSVSINVYRKDDYINGLPYAKCVYAPGGDWSKADDSAPESSYKLKFEIIKYLK